MPISGGRKLRRRSRSRAGGVDDADRLLTGCAAPTEAETCPTGAPTTSRTYDEDGNQTQASARTVRPARLRAQNVTLAYGPADQTLTAGTPREDPYRLTSAPLHHQGRAKNRKPRSSLR